MAETRKASTKAAGKRTTPNESDDLPHGVVEELAALRAIVEGTAHNTVEEFIQTLVRHLARTVDAPLLVSTYDGNGDLTSVTLFGINVTSLFELPL